MQRGYQQSEAAPWAQATGRPALHEGVRTFMNGVYAWMAAGLAVSAAVAWALSHSLAAIQFLYGSGMGMIVMLAPLAMAWFLPARIPSMRPGMAAASFFLFAAVLGAGLTYVPLMAASSPEFMSVVAEAFVTTVGVFGGMALFGFVTKKDLSGMAQFLIMALIGAIVASFINLFFMQSGGMSMIVSIVVAIAAAGLTAYHTQAIKQMYLVNGARGNLAVLGALALYVDFVNLFVSLLRLFAGSRD